MNDMQTALRVAGVKLPAQNQRIWQYLKDFGPHGVKDIAGEVKVGVATVQAYMTDMMARGMLEVIRRVDHKGKRITSHYAALGKEFVLLTKTGEQSKKPATWTKRIAPAPTPTPTPEHMLVTFNLPRNVVSVYTAHAKEYGVTISDVLRLALEHYAKKVGLQVPTMDPLLALRRKLEGGVL